MPASPDSRGLDWLERVSVLIAWLSPLLAGLLVVALQQAMQPPERWSITQLDWVEHSQTIDLPLSIETRSLAPEQHFRTSVTLQPGQLHALYVPSVEHNLEASLDGVSIGGGGKPLAAFRYRHRPLWMPIPLASSVNPEQQLELSIVSPAPWIELPQLYLGPAAELEPAYQWRLRYKLDGMVAVTSALWLMAGLSAALWWARRDWLLGWFALGLGFWGLHNLNFLLLQQPFDPKSWQLLIHMALAGFVYCMTKFAHRLLGRRAQRGERWLLMAYGLALLLMLALAMSGEMTATDAINLALRPLLLLNSLYLTGLYLRAAWHAGNSRTAWLNGASMTTFAFGLHDTLAQVGLLPIGSALLTQYSALPVLVVFGYVMLARFTDADDRRRSEISRITQALDTESEGRLALERSATLHRERERIMRDMHDGIGGQLVSLLAAVRRGGTDPAIVEATVDQALKDLRLIIDSLDEASEDLAVALGMFRNRAEPMLTAAKLQSRWDTADLPDGVNLGPERLLHVYRVVQEALQNVLKHAQASFVTIGAKVIGHEDHARLVEVRIADDGVGIEAATDDATESPVGHGLGNMRERAQQAGGTIEIRSLEQGTEVILRVPWRRQRH